MKPIVEWIVAEGDGTRVADILAKAAGPERARVFLNGRLADGDDRVEPGDRVELYPQRDSFRGRGGPDPVDILAQRDGIILAYKPAGLPTETTKLGQDSLVSELMTLLKSGRVHAASRLDTMVSGIVVCTLGEDANRRVAAGHLARTYVAIAAGAITGEGTWDAPLARVRDRAGRHRARPNASGAKPAITHYRATATVDRITPATWLELTPDTGRMHQLRAHAAHAGAPLFGDGSYDGPLQITAPTGKVELIGNVALHCRRVALGSLHAEAPPPPHLLDLWHVLGGDPS